MSQIIDCFFIGPNEIKFSEYEKRIKLMGTDTGAYRQLNFDFIPYNNELYSANEIFNLFHYENRSRDDGYGPLSFGNEFSGTISYLGTYLNKNGFSFDYVNSFREEKDYLIEKLMENNIRLIAIPTTFYSEILPIIEIVSLVKKYNSTAKIVIGGPFLATQIRVLDESYIQFFLKPMNSDFYIISSQGERALVNLLHALKDNTGFDGICNLYYKKDNKYVKTAIELEDNKLEDNMVDWGLFKDRLTRSVNMRTSISCPFSCSYCSFPQYAGKYQTVSIEAIEKELNTLAATGKVESITIFDDTLNVPPKRFKEILRMMIKNRYGFKWNSCFRCQFADEETVKLMKESGCELVLLGIESASQEILNNMNKSVTVDKYRRGIELLKKYDIQLMASFIIGFPGETEKTVHETVQFIKEYEPSFYHLNLWYCNQLTPIWKEVDKYDIKGSQFEWSHKTMNSETSSRLILENVKAIKNSSHLPKYNFEYTSVVNMLHRGMTVPQVKQFLNYFNTAVFEKLSNPSQTNISQEIAQNLKKLSNWDR